MKCPDSSDVYVHAQLSMYASPVHWLVHYYYCMKRAADNGHYHGIVDGVMPGSRNQNLCFEAKINSSRNYPPLLLLLHTGVYVACNWTWPSVIPEPDD